MNVRKTERKGREEKRASDLDLTDPAVDFPFFLKMKSLQRRGADPWNVDHVAAALDVSVTQFRQYAAGHTNFPVDKLGDLWRGTGDADVLEFLAKKMGFNWFLGGGPQGPMEEEADDLVACAEAMREAAEVVEKFCRARMDGGFSAAELRELEREYREAERALAKLMWCARRGRKTES